MLMAGARTTTAARKYQTLQSLTCERRLFKAPVYHGPPDHVYNTIRPILHEPGPDRQRRLRRASKGIPITEGEVLRRVAVHDNHNLHVASMGFWSTMVRQGRVGASTAARCRTTSSRSTGRSASTARRTTTSKVPQLAKPQRRRVGAFDGNPLEVGDDFFRPGTITAKVGEPVTWRFGGEQAARVTVANGPRGFSSVYWASTGGTVHASRRR